jgi:hypothetical protein
MTKTLKYNFSKKKNRTRKLRGGIWSTFSNKNKLPFMYFYNLRENKKTKNNKTNEHENVEGDEEYESENAGEEY